MLWGLGRVVVDALRFTELVKYYKVYRLLRSRDLPLSLGKFSEDKLEFFHDLDHYFGEIMKDYAEWRVPECAPPDYCALDSTTISKSTQDFDDAVITELMMGISDAVACYKISGTLSSKRFATLGEERQRRVVTRLQQQLIDIGHGELTCVELIRPCFSAPKSLWWVIHRVSVYAFIRTLSYGVEFGHDSSVQRLESFFSSVRIRNLSKLPYEIMCMDTRLDIDWMSLPDCKDEKCGKRWMERSLIEKRFGKD